MTNILTSIQRFLSNKNTVTIIAVILGIVVIYLGYNWRVKEATNPVSVPYAKQEISSRTLITESMIGYMQIPKNMVTKNANLVTSSGNIIGKYAAFGTTIPTNSLFYSSALMEAAEMPDSAFADIKDGYTVFSLNVTLQTTYGNSIFPGNAIDLYIKYVDDTGKIVFGKFIESIEVMAVKDSSGNHVFETTVESRTPSELLFAVPDYMFELLMKSKYIGYSLVILPIPRNASYSADKGETQIASMSIEEFIKSKTVLLPEGAENPNRQNVPSTPDVPNSDVPNMME